MLWQWMKDHKWWLLGAAILAAGGYGAGRYAAPSKVVTVEVEKVVERVVEKKVVKKGPVHYKKVVVETPGKNTVTTVTVEKDPVVTYVNRDILTEREKMVEKIVERDYPKIMLGPTIGASFPLSAPSYGGLFGYRIGPVWVIAQGEGNAQGGSARVGAAISF